MNLSQASSRIAFAALMHDLGKFAERAKVFSDHPRLAEHEQQYCPQLWADGKPTNRHTHKHAAHTALALDEIEKFCPDLIKGEMAPFARRDELSSQSHPDSLLNAAAMHHRPDSFLQWIIAAADRVASGFEREDFEKYNHGEDKTASGRNHYQARQLTLLEQISLSHPAQKAAKADLDWRYPLKALSPQAIFPVKREGYEPTTDAPAQQEYQALWGDFLAALEAIPQSHRKSWSLWLDHFDTAWQTFTHAIPSATAFGAKPDVSLYDHCKATAALATALWRWHAESNQTDPDAALALKSRADWNEKKFLLVQGDFFGIQDFIFAEGAETNKAAAKLLRGRSFQVSLFTELAALKVLDACELPPTSQIINAAGKFLIVAPNTEAVKQKLATVREELNAWFLQHSFGLAGLGLVGKTASCNDFLKGNFKTLIDGLFRDLESAKLRRFGLTGTAPAVFAVDYPHGVCQYNNRLPADKSEGNNKASAALSRDQIKLGSELARKDRILVLREGTELRSSGVSKLELPIFGYQLAFTQGDEETGKFGLQASGGSLLRCWDFSLPENMTAPLWHGYARRYVNAYVPRFSETDSWSSDKYGQWESEVDFDKVQYVGKTLNHIACEDRTPFTEREGWQGQVALMTLKGDVDNLGRIFEAGLAEPTFAKMAALSRQMNAFFALWLPALCASEPDFADTYTVFAGGDDFFLIGPWHKTQKLAARMAGEFKRYVAENPEIHFSAGMVMTKPGQPIATLATQAEEALDQAKNDGKNAVVLFGERVCWAEWPKIQGAQEQLDLIREQYDLSTGYVYGLLHLIDLASDTTNPESAMWRSRFAYRTRRYVVDKIKDHDKRQRAQTELTMALGEQGIAGLSTRYRIPLFNHFYRQR
jgi:CRISPR-associated protein Csm1